jgi:hypothetical protein
MNYRLAVATFAVVLVNTGAGAARADAPPDSAPAGATAAPSSANDPNAKKRDEEEKDTAHFRIGFGLDGNYLFASGLNGAAIGLQLRLGAQVNQWFAVYYQGHALVGGIVGGSEATGAGVLGAGFNSLMAELTLPLLHLGAGPSIDYVGIAGCSATSGCSPETGAHFGIDGRAALVIGGHGPGRHGGFAINFNVHPTFIDGSVLTTLSLGLGGEFY